MRMLIQRANRVPFSPMVITTHHGEDSNLSAQVEISGRLQTKYQSRPYNLQACRSLRISRTKKIYVCHGWQKSSVPALATLRIMYPWRQQGRLGSLAGSCPGAFDADWLARKGRCTRRAVRHPLEALALSPALSQKSP